MQCRVIDTIELRDSSTHRYPDLAIRGEGVIAVIEPTDCVDPAGLRGLEVRVDRPDGTQMVTSVDLAKSPSGALGLFFRDRWAVDVLRGATIAWQDVSLLVSAADAAARRS